MKYFIVVITLFLFLIDTISAQEMNGRIIWSESVLLSDTSYDAALPRIALAGDDTVCITWWGGGIGMKLPLKRSVDGGKTFEPTRDLIQDTVNYPHGTGIIYLGAYRNKVYMFFAYPSAYYPYTTPIRMVESTDGGETWGQIRSITWVNSSWVQTVAVTNDTLAVVYEHQPGILNLLVSRNDGTTWSSSQVNPYNQISLALTSHTLHLVQDMWKNNMVEVEYLRSSNLGYSWNQDQYLSTLDGMGSDLPMISGYNNKFGTELLTVWRDSKYGNCDMWVGSIIGRTSIDNGKTWLPENVFTKVDEPKGALPFPTINNNVRAVGWFEDYNCFDTIQPFVRGTNSSLTSYEPLTSIAPTDFNAGDLAIAVSEHSIHTVYMSQVKSHYRIFYRRGEFVPYDVNFSLSDNTVAFDSTEMNETTSRVITVYNSGKDTMIVGTAIADNVNFSIEPTSAEVNPFDSVHFLVKFTPTTKGTFTGKIIFYHNGTSSPDCIMVTGKGVWGNEKITYKPGWQLVSIPVVPGPNQVLPSMYAYNNGYVLASKMQFGKGYWAKPSEAVFFQGGKSLSDSVSVKAGWNLIGALSEQMTLIELSSVPSSIIESQFYGYDSAGYYVADVLKPGFGYWVKVREDGVLILNSDM